MHDVARLAGVSHQTVSRVINDSPNVKAATRDRVLDAMRQLDYRPNSLARSLATSRTNRIGVISFDVRFFGPGSTLVAIERAAHDQGYGIALASMTGLVGEEASAAVAMLDAQRVDGLIVIAPHQRAIDAMGSLPRTVPVVALEAEYRPDVSVVAVDQRFGARLATQHLLDLGHRTVTHIAGPPDWHEAQLRADGWAETLDCGRSGRAGARSWRLVVALWLRSRPGAGRTRRCHRRLRGQRPDGLGCAARIPRAWHQRAGKTAAWSDSTTSPKRSSSYPASPRCGRTSTRWAGAVCSG